MVFGLKLFGKATITLFWDTLYILILACGGCPTPTIDNSIINPTPFATNSITTDASGCSVLTLACTGTGPGLAYVAVNGGYYADSMGSPTMTANYVLTCNNDNVWQENVFIKFPGATIAVGCST
ncbi:unnamed protein product, partial [Mesorhabditis spiculigera]